MNIYNGTPIVIPDGLEQSRRKFCNRAIGTCFDVHAAAGVTEIDLYDEIGYWGIDAKEFRSRLRDAGDVRLRINSPGGDVFDGITMYNDLIEHDGKVSVQIPGVAASAASLLAMAADDGALEIAPTGFIMMHNAWAMCVGNRHDMTSVAATLGQIDSALCEIYERRTDKDQADIEAIMDGETWMRGSEAVDAGFADAVYEPGESEAAAKFDLSSFANTPQELIDLFVAEQPAMTTKRDLERTLTHDARLTRSQARALMRGDLQGTLGAALIRDDGMPDAANDLKPFINLIEEWNQ